jgi:hypothetical protein
MSRNFQHLKRCITTSVQITRGYLMVQFNSRNSYNTVECLHQKTPYGKSHQTTNTLMGTKIIIAMWDHTTRQWHYRNNDVHSRDSKQVAQFTIDALKREKEQIRIIHEELRHKLQDSQVSHLERLTDIEQLHYNRHKCWADLARLYVEESQNLVIPIYSTIYQYLHGRTCIGYLR